MSGDHRVRGGHRRYSRRLPKSARVWLLCSFVGLGCGPAPRSDRPSSTDAATTAPDAPRCGNDVVDPGEGCDDGAATGTSLSSCNMQCIAPSFGFYQPARVRFPNTIQSFTMLAFGEVAAIVDGMIGIQVARVDEPPAMNVMAQVTSLAVASPAIGVGGLMIAQTNPAQPLWIERGEDGVPHLYFAETVSNAIHELPYPFPDGAGGHIVNTQGAPSAIVDISSTTHEVLVALITASSVDDVSITVARFPPLGQVLGVSVAGWDEYDQVSHEPTHSMLQFFADTREFAMIGFDRLNPTDESTPVYKIIEQSTGTWPFDVVDGDMWMEGPPSHEESFQNPELAQLTHPYPFVVLTDTGAIYTWQFDRSPGAEAVVTPFASVAAGTSMIAVVGTSMPGALLWAFEPDGMLVSLNDANPYDVASTSLAPHRKLQFDGPIVRAAKMPGFPSQPISVNADLFLY